VICSDGAGARDHAATVVPARDAVALANAIRAARSLFYGDPAGYAALAAGERQRALGLTWDRIRPQYHDVWAPLI
jgi:hypothetical protein